jgi:hypothetical protein
MGSRETATAGGATLELGVIFRVAQRFTGFWEGCGFCFSVHLNRWQANMPSSGNPPSEPPARSQKHPGILARQRRLPLAHSGGLGELPKCIPDPSPYPAVDAAFVKQDEMGEETKGSHLEEEKKLGIAMQMRDETATA